VPSGNFGNVYSAYAARNMGLPIETLVVGTLPDKAEENGLAHRI
jgi:threonine synthase